MNISIEREDSGAYALLFESDNPMVPSLRLWFTAHKPPELFFALGDGSKSHYLTPEAMHDFGIMLLAIDQRLREYMELVESGNSAPLAVEQLLEQLREQAAKEN